MICAEQLCWNSIKIFKKNCRERPDAGFCPTPQEAELFERIIIPGVEQSQDFLIVVAAHLGRGNFVGTFSHEVLHAQYFNDSAYRNVIDAFWTTALTEKEKIVIREALTAR